VSVMWANNETGILFPVRESRGLPPQGCAVPHGRVQTPGKLKIDVRELDVDFLSLSAHKLHAPKGIGLLHVKRRVKYQPYLSAATGAWPARRHGERRQHVAFGRAAELAMANLDEENTRVRGLRTGWKTEFWAAFPARRAMAPPSRACPIPATSPSLASRREGILMLLDQAGICASSGSACTTGSLDPSHVLTAMGCSAARGPRQHPVQLAS